LSTSSGAILVCAPPISAPPISAPRTRLPSSGRHGSATRPFAHHALIGVSCGCAGEQDEGVKHSAIVPNEPLAGGDAGTPKRRRLVVPSPKRPETSAAATAIERPPQQPQESQPSLLPLQLQKQMQQVQQSQPPQPPQPPQLPQPLMAQLPQPPQLPQPLMAQPPQPPQLPQPMPMPARPIQQPLAGASPASAALEAHAKSRASTQPPSRADRLTARSSARTGGHLRDPWIDQARPAPAAPVLVARADHSAHPTLLPAARTGQGAREK